MVYFKKDTMNFRLKEWPGSRLLLEGTKDKSKLNEKEKNFIQKKRVKKIHRHLSYSHNNKLCASKKQVDKLKVSI